MKHAPNGREESKTARDWDPRTREQRRAVPTAGKHKEFTMQPSVNSCDKTARRVGTDVPEDVPQSENVMRPEGPGKTSTQRRQVQNTMVRISSQ